MNLYFLQTTIVTPQRTCSLRESSFRLLCNKISIIILSILM